ncbi:MAG: hypothetical protein HY300_04540, partial [Verrucomicrobia bacterium]|nr:hypothetical protein [Verrucomicrobiota bacterium]
HWPGNVRELRNVIERAVILEETSQIQPASLPDFEIETRLRKSGASSASDHPQALDEAVAAFERQLIINTLVNNNYSINKTAEHLRVTRHALRYRMQRLNISTDGSTEEETQFFTKESINAPAA